MQRQCVRIGRCRFYEHLEGVLAPAPGWLVPWLLAVVVLIKGTDHALLDDVH